MRGQDLACPAGQNEGIETKRRFPKLSSMPGLVRYDAARSVARYDPGEGLTSIAVAKVSEQYWARAKDATKLFQAIEAKIRAQAKYVVWRDGKVGPGGDGSNQHSRAIISAPTQLLPAADPGHVAVHRWRKRLCHKTANGATVLDPEKVALALQDAQHRCQRICEQQNMGTVRGTEGTGEFERYTPGQYIEATRSVLGGIDLDPATCEAAQKTVRAAEYFTIEDDGLARAWHGRVWLNPPYHRDLLSAFVDKLGKEIRAGRVTTAIMLTNNCTDTGWFAAAMALSGAICFTRGRIRFAEPDGREGTREMGMPTQGQAFFYYRHDVGRFVDVFSEIGSCVSPLWPRDEFREAGE
jgi:phage N-6-adenine-methyltransferase